MVYLGFHLLSFAFNQWVMFVANPVWLSRVTTKRPASMLHGIRRIRFETSALHLRNHHFTSSLSPLHCTPLLTNDYELP